MITDTAHNEGDNSCFHGRSAILGAGLAGLAIGVYSLLLTLLLKGDFEALTLDIIESQPSHRDLNFS